MGCGASSEPVRHQHGGRPQATVKPYPQAQRQQQRQQVNYNPQKTEIAVKDIQTTKALLQQYLDIDNEVRALEAKNANKKLTDMQAEQNAIRENIAALEKAYADAQKATAKEKGEYDDIFTVWSETTTEGEEANPELMKEKREWIEAKGAEEVAKKELEAMRVKLAATEANVKTNSQSSDILKQKHKEQEELLAAIFKGKYGSDYENKLEAEFDFLDDRKQRVAAARYKWTNGRNLINHATAQLCVACKKWMMLLSMNPVDQRARYAVATETRNNIIAATQNITSAKRYLSTIQFPYCKPQEVKVLEMAATHVYTDMQSHQRHQYVYANVYHSMYKRSKALVDWFSHVLASTIEKDLREAATASHSKAKELRQERLNLISLKIKEELQQEVQFEARQAEIEEDSMSLEEDNSQVIKADGVESEGTAEEDSGADEEPPAAEVEAEEPFNPIPLNELVQAPNKEDLFGDAQELYKRHQENLEELEKNQMINKARQEQGLEEKLKARRSRKQRQAAIEAELNLQQQAE